LLLLCDSIEHGNALLKKLLKRCKERNVFLKLSKTNIMVKECNFFGYKVTCADDTGRKGTISIADDKREQIDAMPFPALPRLPSTDFRTLSNSPIQSQTLSTSYATSTTTCRSFAPKPSS